MYVLTAAHCIQDEPVSVYLGEYDTSKPIDCYNGVCADELQVIKVAAFITHENFTNKTYQNDIALLRLETPAKFSKWVKPICLPFGNVLNYKMENRTLVAAGFGSLGNHTHPAILQTVDIPIVSNAVCSDIFERDLIETQICGGGMFGQVCN